MSYSKEEMQAMFGDVVLVVSDVMPNFTKEGLSLISSQESESTLIQSEAYINFELNYGENAAKFLLKKKQGAEEKQLQGSELDVFWSHNAFGYFGADGLIDTWLYWLTKRPAHFEQLFLKYSGIFSLLCEIDSPHVWKALEDVAGTYNLPFTLLAESVGEGISTNENIRAFIQSAPAKLTAFIFAVDQLKKGASKKEDKSMAFSDPGEIGAAKFDLSKSKQAERVQKRVAGSEQTLAFLIADNEEELANEKARLINKIKYHKEYNQIANVEENIKELNRIALELAVLKGEENFEAAVSGQEVKKTIAVLSVIGCNTVGKSALKKLEIADSADSLKEVEAERVRQSLVKMMQSILQELGGAKKLKVKLFKHASEELAILEGKPTYQLSPRVDSSVSAPSALTLSGRIKKIESCTAIERVALFNAYFNPKDYTIQTGAMKHFVERIEGIPENFLRVMPKERPFTSKKLVRDVLKNRKKRSIPALEFFNSLAVEPVKMIAPKEKASLFLSVIEEIITIFDNCEAWGEDELAKRAILQKYEGFFREQIKNKKDIGSKCYKDEVKYFYYSIGLFFESCEAQTQERILSALETARDTSAKNDAVKKSDFLQKINQKLQKIKKINALDQAYNAKADALLDIYLIAESIHHKESLFSFMDEQRTSRPSAKGKLREKLEKLPKRMQSISFGSKKKRSSFEPSTLEQFPDSIYEAIKIKEGLFDAQVACDSKKIGGMLGELKKNEATVLNQLIGISEELLVILKELKITKPQIKLIENFLSELRHFLVEQQALSARANAKIVADSYENQEAIDIFFAIYEKSALEKQKEHSSSLMDYLEQIDGLLEEHKSDLKSLNLEKIKSFGCKLQSMFLQVCSRRQLHSEEIVKSLVFDAASRDRAVTCYKEMSYILTRENLVRAAKEDGYFRPKELMGLLATQLNKNIDYSIAYFLTHPDCDKNLKKAFLFFANEQKGAKDKLHFFGAVCKILRIQPLSLESLEPLRDYFTDDNPLGLEFSHLRAIQNALIVGEMSESESLQQVVTALMPVIYSVNHSLMQILKKFQQSPDIIDVIHNVPEIKEKLGENTSLAALDDEDIRTLPGFWKEVFTDEKSALRRLFTRKKHQLLESRDIPEAIYKGLAPILDNEITIENFHSMRAVIARNFIEREVNRQITLLEDADIFDDRILKGLKAHGNVLAYNISRKFTAFRRGGVGFLMAYADALLEAPYFIMRALANGFMGKEVDLGKILSPSSLKRLGSEKGYLSLYDLERLLSDEYNQYFIRERQHLKKIAAAPSVFRLFNLVSNRSNPNLYLQLSTKIIQLGRAEGKSDKKNLNLVPAAPPKQKYRSEKYDRPRIQTEAGLNAIFPSSNFKSFVARIEKTNKQGRVKKYVQSDSSKLKLCTDATILDCNYIKVYGAKKEDLIFTAQSKVDSSELSLPEGETLVQMHGHKEEYIVMAVSALAESSAYSDNPTLEIAIDGSEKETSELMRKYVSVALQQGFQPKVSVNKMLIEDKEVHQILKDTDRVLASKYQKMVMPSKKVSISQNLTMFLGPSQPSKKEKSTQHSGVPGKVYKP